MLSAEKKFLNNINNFNKQVIDTFAKKIRKDDKILHTGQFKSVFCVFVHRLYSDKILGKCLGYFLYFGSTGLLSHEPPLLLRP